MRWPVAGMLGLAFLVSAIVPVRADDVAAISTWTTGTTGPSRFTSGANRLLIFTAGMEANTNVTITSATYGGRPMTQLVTTSAGTSPYNRVYIFYLKEADIVLATSNNFAVTWSGSTIDSVYSARMFSNVDQSNPIRGSSFADSDFATPNPIVTGSLTVLAGDLVIAAAHCGNPNTYTWNNSFVEGTDQTSSTSQHSSAERSITTSGTVIASATNSNPNRQVIVGAVLAHVHQPVSYYVRTDGSDLNSGTAPNAGTAWRTVTGALTKTIIQPGDIIYVRTGTYSGTILPSIDGASGSPIRVVADNDGTIFGGNGGSVILTATSLNRALDVTNDDYLHFEGFTFRGASSIEAVEVDSSTGIMFTNCIVHSAGGDGIVLRNTCSVTVINCILRDNTQHGIEVVNTGGALIVWNSTFAHNGLDGVKAVAGNVTVTNSIMAYNGDDGLDRDSGSFAHSYNLVFSNAGFNFEGLSQVGSEIAVNPLFADVVGRDYHLQSASPAINAGTSAVGTVDRDLDGNSRPIATSWDLGCYEYALLGHWKFDQGSGTTAADSSGNNRHGVLQGSSTWAAAHCGQSIMLDGLTSWVNLGQIELGSKAYTVSAWFKTSRPTPQTIVAVTANGTSNHLLFVELDAQGHVRFVHRSPVASSGGTTLASAETYRDGTWHHVAAVKSTSQLRLYVDGELVGTAADATSVHSSVDVVLGRYGVSLGQQYFQGSLDEVQLYGSALSNSEVAALTGLVGRWRLDESTGTTATDTSIFGNNGALSSGFSFNTSSVSPAKIGNGLQFNGTSNYIAIPNAASLQITSSITISAWIKGNAWSSADNVNAILRKGEANPNNFQLAVADGRVGLFLDDGDGGGFRGNTMLVAGTWHHVAATWDGSEVIVYVNGEMDHGAPYMKSGSIAVDSRSLYLGGRSGTDCFNGALDDIRVYNRALCGDEIYNLFQGGRLRGVRIIKWVEIQ